MSLQCPYNVPGLKTLKRWSKAFNWQKRSYPQVALKFTVSKTSIKKWSGAFNWMKRIETVKNGKKTDESGNKAELIN
jgi:hypothetical protein